MTTEMAAAMPPDASVSVRATTAMARASEIKTAVLSTLSPPSSFPTLPFPTLPLLPLSVPVPAAQLSVV